MTKFDYAVIIGRFQLPHKQHFFLMERALEEADNLVVAIGSSNMRRSLHNPFSFEQRVTLIEQGATEVVKKAILNGRVRFTGIQDSYYSDQWWVEHVQRKIGYVIRGNLFMRGDENKTPTICLVGCNKDDSTYYLEMFPQWEQVMVPQTQIFSATDCRNAYYEYGIDDKRAINLLYDYTTSSVIDALRYMPKSVHEGLQKRFFFVKEYQEKWGKGPHYTADAVVIKSGHVLLIERGEEPDAGCLAFPGGFVNKDESSLAAAVRECREETDLNLLQLTAIDNYEYNQYSKANRDDRGNVCTSAYLWNLGNGPLPEVKGMDDAKSALWVPMSELTSENMALDHYHIWRDLIRKA